MKKGVLAGFVLFLLFLANLAAQDAFVLRVKVQTANVRSEPDANSPVIKQLKGGTLLESSQKLENWYEITITDSQGQILSGYIHANVVEVVSSQAVEEEEIKEEVVQEKEEITPPTPQRIPMETPGEKWYSTGGFKVIGGLASSKARYPEQDLQGFDLADYEKSRMGIFGGLGFEMGSRFVIEVDLMYLQKGAAIKGDIDFGNNGSVSFDYTSMTDELSLPILLKTKFLRGNTPYILAGAEIAYVLSSKVNYDFSVKQPNAQPVAAAGTEDIIEVTNRIDYGLILGAGFELQLGKMPLLFEGRYHLGMANLAKQNTDYQVEVGEDDWVKTSALLFMLGFRF